MKKHKYNFYFIVLIYLLLKMVDGYLSDTKVTQNGVIFFV